uniref:Phosphoinositide phospholipase C n=1 Tax=Nothobranchius korthausae TaxID=1143690 RepID=A0A1A8H2F3_9TELE
MLGSAPSASSGSREQSGKAAMKSSDSIKSLGLMDNEDVGVMLQGSSMVKVRSLRWQKSRSLRLLEDGLTVWCESTKRSSKAKSQQTFAITEVECVREGCQSEALRRLSGSVPDNQCFTVVFSGARKSLDLRCHSADEAQRWVRGLRFLKHQVASMTQKEKLDHWIQSYLRRADENRDGKMTYDEVKRLLQMINIDLSEQYSRNLFKRCDRSGDGRLDHSEIEGFCRELMRRPELDAVFRHYSSSGSVLSIAELRDFLGDQGEDASLKHAQSLILAYELNDWAQKNKFMTQNGFAMYMLSLENDVFNPSHARVYQDMRHPLAHYFISSSHNTYLTKDQVTSASSTEPYIRALNQGCRCVELDVWDGPDNEPVIYTGHTMTSQIVFRSVIDVINKYAFVASEFPLILCLENHCSLKQQKVMFQHLKKILGDKMYVDSPKPDDCYLPSPSEMKGKILLKGKKLDTNCTNSEGEVTDEDEGAEMSQKMSIESTEQQTIAHKKFQLLKDLSDLVTLCKSVEFKDFPTSFQNQKPWELCSFNEVFATRCACDFPGDFVNYNKKFLARVYPSPMRIDSSNMNPQDFWKCGCQIVAMNYQTPGLMMDLNIGWFRQNGNCGYVLRPAIMREQVSYFSANTKDSVPGVSPQLLHIKIISGQNFPKPKGSGAKGDVVDPYMYVEIHGIPADCAEQRTKTVHQNGDNPLFDESFEFQINLPELAMVRFVVLDDDFIGDEFIGQYTIPFECLQPGFRHVPLQSLTGEVLPNTLLFVHVAITNRRGGGKPHKRGLSVRKGKKCREYASMRVLQIKAVDDVFKTALLPLREGTDLRENMQNAIVSFKELCGLSAVANLKQCILALSPRLTGPDNNPLLLFSLTDQYPNLEPQGLLPEVLKKVTSTYDMVIQTSKTLLESCDSIYDRILQTQKAAMEFHENLHDLSVKEGLKGRKLQKAVESFTWNITILKGQADLLKHARSEVQENLKQIHYAALTCNLSKGGAGGGSAEARGRRSLEAIPEKALAEEELTDEDG